MSVKKHVAYNLLGSIAPMFVSVLSVPAFLHLIGDARYGVLSLVWLFLGYFGLFDPGITRAAAFHIARLHKVEESRERESVFWTALAVNLAFGLVGGLILYFAARPFFLSTFKMPESMRGEVMASLPWLAASVPLSIVTGILGGALQARESFGAYNAISTGNAFASQLVPLAVAYLHGPSLTWLIPAALIARTIGTIPSFVVLFRVLPLNVGGGFDRTKLRSLFSYGGWVTITNLINPILTSMDRMLTGSILSAQAVAYYSVPFNLVSRASVVPGALADSLFPRLSRGTQEDSARLAENGLAALSAVMTPIIVIMSACLPIFMQIWVGKAFSEHSTTVGLILLVGVWVNSLAFIPYGQLQATNRPDIPAKFHAIEVLPFLAVLWVGLHYFGLIGAAVAWSLRVTIDAVLLFVVAGQTPGWKRVLPGGLLVILSTLVAPSHLLSIRTVLELLVIAATGAWSWFGNPYLRQTILRYLGERRVVQAT